MAKKNFLLAEKKFLNVLSLQPDNIEAHKGLFWIYINTENFDKALEEVKTLGNLEPENFNPRHILADRLFESKNFLKAIENYKILLNKEPGNYDIYLYIGKSYRAISDYKNAIKWFNKTLEINVIEKQEEMIKKEISLTYLQEGKNFFKKEHYKEAKKSFLEVLNYSSEKELIIEAENYIAIMEPTAVPYIAPSYQHYNPPVYNPPPSNINELMWD